MLNVQEIRQKDVATKNTIMFIAYGISGLLGTLVYWLTDQGMTKTVSMAVPFVLTILFYLLARKFRVFEVTFPWLVLAVMTGATLTNGYIGEPSIATAGIAFFIAGLASVHASLSLMSYGAVLAIAVELMFVTEYPYQAEIASSKSTIMLVLILMCFGLFLQIRQSKKLAAQVEDLLLTTQVKAQEEEWLVQKLNRAVVAITSNLERIRENAMMSAISQREMLVAINEVSVGS